MNQKQPVTEIEREQLQEALAHYKNAYGMGYQRFFEEIYYYLPPNALSYISLSTFQRFVRGDRNPKTGKLIETSDVVIRGLQEAFEKMRPFTYSVKLAQTILDNLNLPDEGKLSDTVQPMYAYEGSYELYKVPYTGKFEDAEFNEEPERTYIAMIPTRDARILNALISKRKRMKFRFGSFFRCSETQFMLAHVSPYEVESIQFFTQTDTNPLTLQGQGIINDSERPTRGQAYDFKLVRVKENLPFSKFSRRPEASD